MDRLLHRPLIGADANQALALYSELTFGPATNDAAAFERVISDHGTSVIGTFADDQLIAMLTLHLLPNVTWGHVPTD